MKNTNIRQKGKIKQSILVVALCVLFFLLGLNIMRTYKSTQSPVATSTEKTISNSTSTKPKNPTQITPVEKVPVFVPPITLPKIPQKIGHAVGIAGGGGLSKISLENLNKQLDQMVALGITWVRFDIEWGLVQYSSPNKSTWSSYDTVVNALAAHNLQGLGIIVFTPEWARDPKCSGGAKCPPKDPNTYAKFAAEVVDRYKGKIDAWEIWNEENNYDFWATQTDCVAYTNLLKVTYPAIKKVNPNAIVITGGLAPVATDKHNVSRRDFLTCIYKSGGKDYFDAVGDHPYTYPKLPSENDANGWGQMSKTNPSMRSIMIANGDANKKIWITEFGVPTNGPDPYWRVTEQGQVDTVIDTIKLYKTYDWAGPIFFYTLKDPGTTTNTNENFFGFVRFDGA